MTQGETLFQSTPPARGATVRGNVAHGAILFQSTPPARGATACVGNLQKSFKISIHAPREGGDCYKVVSLRDVA